MFLDINNLCNHSTKIFYIFLKKNKYSFSGRIRLEAKSYKKLIRFYPNFCLISEGQIFFIFNFPLNFVKTVQLIHFITENKIFYQKEVLTYRQHAK